MNKRIEILVQPDGRTEVRTIGFSGNECLQASQLIERALGKVESQELTQDFFTETKNQTTVNEGNGQ